MLPVGLAMALSLFGDLTLFAVLVTQLDRAGDQPGRRRASCSAFTAWCASLSTRWPAGSRTGWGGACPSWPGWSWQSPPPRPTAWCSGFWPFLLARMAWGVAWSLINVGGIAMALDLSDGSNRGRLTGIYNTWIWVGYGVGPVIGSLLTDALGFRSAMLVCAAFSAVGLALPRCACRRLHPSGRSVRLHPPGIHCTVPRGTRRRSDPPRSRWIYKGMFIYAANQFAMDGIILSTVTLLIAQRIGESLNLFGLAFGAASAVG